MEDDANVHNSVLPDLSGNKAVAQDVSRNNAGICSGALADCAIWQRARGVQHGVRTHAQLRLNGCNVDFERLRSTTQDGDEDASRRGKDIRRLMRRMYGAPDQDYEDWQIVVLSDELSDGARCLKWLHCPVKSMCAACQG